MPIFRWYNQQSLAENGRVCVCAHMLCIYIYIIIYIYICTVAYVYYSYDSEIYIYIVWEISWLQPSDKPPCNILHLAWRVIPRWRFRAIPASPLFDPWDWYVCLTRYSRILFQNPPTKKRSRISCGFIWVPYFNISPAGDRILVSQLISPLVYPFTLDLIGQYSRGIWYVAWQKWSIQNPATTFLIFDN